MRVRAKDVKVRCGGWVLVGEKTKHEISCEYCLAIQDHEVKKINRVFAAIMVLLISRFIALIMYVAFSGDIY